MFSRKLKKRLTYFITWSHKEIKTSQKDSWVLRSRIVVISPLQVIKVVLKANKTLNDGCSEIPASQICNFFQMPKFKTLVLWAL